MILSDRDIRKRLDSGDIKITPAPDLASQLGSASLDLRLSSKFRVFKPTSTPYIDPRNPATFAELTTSVDVAEAGQQPLLPQGSSGPRPFIVHPRDFVLGMTEEHVELPADIAARIEGRSSLGRLGIVIHATAGHIDPGYVGGITLEITNLGTVPVLLYPGMRFCQLVFDTMTSPVQTKYSDKKGAKYAGTVEPGASKLVNETGQADTLGL